MRHWALRLGINPIGQNDSLLLIHTRKVSPFPYANNMHFGFNSRLGVLLVRARQAAGAVWTCIHDLGTHSQILFAPTCSCCKRCCCAKCRTNAAGGKPLIAMHAHRRIAVTRGVSLSAAACAKQVAHNGPWQAAAAAVSAAAAAEPARKLADAAAAAPTGRRPRRSASAT